MRNKGDLLQTFHIHTKAKELSIGEDRHVFYVNACREMRDKIEILENRGSGWNINRINKLFMNQTRVRPLAGASYMPLPDWIANKNAIINIQSNDNQCFKWSVLAHLHPAERNTNRVTHYRQYENELDFKGFEFPFKVSDIPKFEKRNNLSINVLSFKEYQRGSELKREIVRFCPSKRFGIEDNRVINLMWHQQNGNVHYSLIKNINRLLGDRSDGHKQNMINILKIVVKKIPCNIVLH